MSIIDDNTMKTVVAKAILDEMTTEKRDELITNAIKQLMAQPTSTSYYGDKKSELQRTFDIAVNDVARRLIVEKLKNDEGFAAQIKSVMDAAVAKAFSADGGTRDVMVDRIADAIVKSMEVR